MKRITGAFFFLTLATSCMHRPANGSFSFQTAGINQRLDERHSSESLLKSDCDESVAPGGMVRSDCIEYGSTSNVAVDQGADESIGGR